MQKKNTYQRVKINEGVRADTVRVIGEDGAPLGVLSLKDAIFKAKEKGLDLVLVTEKANPPVCRITDYGKYLYNQNKKKKMSSRGKESKTKSIQIKPTTGKNELTLRGKKVGEWLEEGHRVNVDLFLWGRYKYMDEVFLKRKLEVFLEYITHPYESSGEIQKSPKGFSIIVQRTKSGKSEKNIQNENKQSNTKES